MFPSKLEDLRALLATNLNDYKTKEDRLDVIVGAVEGRADQTLTADETAEIEAIRTATATLKADRESLKAEITKAEARAADRAEADELARSLPTAGTTTTGHRVAVRSEERIYRPGGAHGFLADVYARDMNRGDSRSAADRLYRHEQQAMDTEYRDIVSSTVAGALPPKYLLDQFSPIARAGRPFLNALNTQALPPDFMSTVIPRGTTGSLAGLVPEGSGFFERDMVVTNDTPVVQLIGGQQDLSRALFERGGAVVDSILFPDLIADAERVCNFTALNGTSATTSILGPLQVAATQNTQVVAYTDASPTVPELWPKISDAIQRVNANRFAPANAVFMHPRRWGWITAALDTQNRPLFNFNTNVPDDPYIALGTAKAYGQIVGTLQGLPVITDANIPTTWASGVVSSSGTEDVIIVANTLDFIDWEDPIMRFTFEQTPSTAPGQVRLAAGRFIFAHFNRYATGISLVSGTGLVTPSF